MTAEQAIQRGDALRAAGDSEGAEQAYRTALELEPGQPAAMRSLSAVLRDSGRLDEALSLAETLVAAHPAEPWFHVQLANVLALLERPAAAAASYRQALELQSHLPDVPAALARQCHAMGDLAGAAEAYGLEVAQNPGELRIMRRIAGLYHQLDRPADARPWLRRAAALGDGEAAAQLAPAQDPDLEDALARVAPLVGEGAEISQLTRGSQNRVFHLRSPQGQFALRLARFPAARWDFYCEERHNARIAHQAGLAPEIHFFDTADGTMLTRFMAGETLDYATFLRAGLVRRAGGLFRRLHAGPGFLGKYDILDMVAATEARIGRKPMLGLEELPELGAAFDRVARALRHSAPPPAPCHNDPVPHNFIASEGGLVLLDWQCSGMADPHWEVGAFSAQLELSPGLEKVFFTAALGSESGIEAARSTLYKAVCRYYWMTNALARGQDGAADEAWKPEAEANAGALAYVMDTPSFRRALQRLET